MPFWKMDSGKVEDKMNGDYFLANDCCMSTRELFIMTRAGVFMLKETQPELR
jgi:hypothetical protein